MEAGTGRDLEKRGRDGPKHMTHHSSWHWHETFTAPRLLSLPLPPSSSAVPAAQLSPTQEQAAGASTLLSHEASQTHGSSHTQPMEAPSSPEPCAAGVVRQGWLGAILPRHGGQPVLAGTPHCLQNPLQFAPQPAPAGRHARAATSPARAPWHSRGSPILTSPAAPRATLAHPHLQPFEHLGPAPSSRVPPGLPQPTNGAHWKQGPSSPPPLDTTTATCCGKNRGEN